MSEISLDEKMRYYNELALRLKGMGFGIHGLSPESLELSYGGLAREGALPDEC